MKTVILVWQGLMIMQLLLLMRRIRMRRIEPSGPSQTNTSAAATLILTTPVATLPVPHRPAANVHRRCVTVSPASPSDEEAVGVGAVALEQDNVAGVEALVFDVAAPPFGQHVALAAVPVGVAKPPALTRLVLETQ